MTAFYGNGKRSEWRFRLTPEELVALEKRERPRLEAARARRQAAREERQRQREEQAEARWAAEVMRYLAKTVERDHRYVDNHKRCGARTRKDGSPCQSVAIRSNGRCKWHGAMSTGPRTEEGKQRCREGRRRQVEADRAAGIKRPYSRSAEGQAAITAGLRRSAVLKKLRELGAREELAS